MEFLKKGYYKSPSWEWINHSFKTLENSNNNMAYVKFSLIAALLALGLVVVTLAAPNDQAEEDTEPEDRLIFLSLACKRSCFIACAPLVGSANFSTSICTCTGGFFGRTLTYTCPRVAPLLGLFGGIFG